MTGLSISLLGHFEATLNDRPIAKFRTKRVQALLAYLVTEDAMGTKSYQREALMELLWPGLLPQSARSNLRQTLYYLRQAVEDLPSTDNEEPVPFLLTDRVSVQINPTYPAHSDVADFNELLQGPQDEWPEAFAIYRGDFLADFYLPDANSFEEWASSRRAAHRRQVLSALDTLTTDHLAQGDFEAAESYALRQLEIDNLRESAYRQLMQLYAWNSRQAEALNLYQECVRVIKDELDADPDEATTALYEAIRQQRLTRPSLEPPDLIQLIPKKEALETIPESPYRGLYAFREEDSPNFFGREAFTDMLVTAADKQAMVAVIGPSGSGKSSVLFAGLVARLHESGGWTISSFRPGSDPFQSLAAALLPWLEPEMSETDRLVETRKLAAALSQGELPLDDVITRIHKKSDPDGRLLLVADQFEEIFTLSPDPDLTIRFLNTIVATISAQRFRPQPIFSLVLSLRADFLGQALNHRAFADELQNADIKLGPMNREELSRAVTRPAEKLGIAYETGLVERILDDVGREPGNLPLLEFALTSLWERQVQGKLNHAAYEKIGHVEGAISRYAEAVFRDLTEVEKEQARHVIVQLVRPGERTGDTRRLATRAEFGDENWVLVQRLAEARLVILDRDPAGQETVELVHESLIQGWERLQSWLEKDRAFRAWQERLRSVLRQWEASGQDEGALLRGAPLNEAQSWLTEQGDQLSQVERAFIQDSLALRDRRLLEQEEVRLSRERTRRRISLGLAAGLIVALLLAALAGWQWNSARQAQAVAEAERDQTQVALSNALASQAELLLDKQLDLSLLLSVEAVRKGDTPEARSSLLTALSENPQIKRFLQGHVDDVRSVAFSPDGNLLASGSADGSIFLWDLETGQPRDTPLMGHTDRIWSVAFSPDGRTLASASFDGTIILWDVDTGSPLASPLTGHQVNVWSVAFGPDGRTLASGGADGAIILWDANRESASFGQPIHPKIEGHEGIVTSVAFSPDGHILASGSVDQSVILWDVAENSPTFGQPLGQPLIGHHNTVTAVAFSPDGRSLASASQDETIILWDISAASSVTDPDSNSALASIGQPIGSPLRGHDDWVTSITFSPDGRILASAGRDNRVQLWDLTPLLASDGSTEEIQSQVLAGHSEPVWSVAFSRDGQFLATGSGDDAVTLWQLNPEHPLVSIHRGHKNVVLDIAYSPQGRTLATAGKDGQVLLWDVATMEQTDHLIGEGSVAARSLAYSPDGHTLATGYTDGIVKLWDVNNGALLGSALSGHSLAVQSMVFSPDGRILATGGADSTIRLRDVSVELDSVGRPFGLPLTGHAGAIESLVFSPVENSLVSGGGDTTILWDLSPIEAGGELNSDAVAGQPIFTFFTNRSYGDIVDFSPDGRLFARASTGTISIVDVNSGTQVGVLTHPTASTTGFKFSPDGRTLASARLNGNVVLWDVPTARSIGSLLVSKVGFNTGVTFLPVAFRPDGNQLALGSGEGSIILWDVDLTSWQSLACERANRNLTLEEWQQFFGDEPYRLTCPDLPSGAAGRE